MVAIDALVFKDPQVSEETDAVFYSVYPKGSAEDTVINRSRAFYLQSVLWDPAFQLRFGIDPGRVPFEEYAPELLQGILPICTDSGTEEIQNCYERFKPIFVWVLGQNKLLGIGRDSKPKFVTEYKKMLQDCTDVNVRFIAITNEVDDDAEVVKAFRWILFDELSASQQTKMKMADYYPKSKAPTLAVIYDKNAVGDEKCFKFKKMLFDGEFV